MATVESSDGESDICESSEIPRTYSISDMLDVLHENNNLMPFKESHQTNNSNIRSDTTYENFENNDTSELLIDSVELNVVDNQCYASVKDSQNNGRHLDKCPPMPLPKIAASNINKKLKRVSSLKLDEKSNINTEKFSEEVVQSLSDCILEPNNNCVSSSGSGDAELKTKEVTFYDTVGSIDYENNGKFILNCFILKVHF